MKLNGVKRQRRRAQPRMRVGRGIGSGKGKQAGRGGKGQTARSGVRIKGFEGGQMPLHRRLPKRGFNPPNAIDLNEVNLGRVQTAIDAGKLDASEPVTVEALVEAGVCARVARRREAARLGRTQIAACISRCSARRRARRRRSRSSAAASRRSRRKAAEAAAPAA